MSKLHGNKLLIPVGFICFLFFLSCMGMFSFIVIFEWLGRKDKLFWGWQVLVWPGFTNESFQNFRRFKEEILWSSNHTFRFLFYLGPDKASKVIKATFANLIKLLLHLKAFVFGSEPNWTFLIYLSLSKTWHRHEMNLAYQFIDLHLAICSRCTSLGNKCCHWNNQSLWNLRNRKIFSSKFNIFLFLPIIYASLLTTILVSMIFKIFFPVFQLLCSLIFGLKFDSN